MLSITYQRHGRFGLKNMPIADEAFVFWDPHRPDDRMLWESSLRLSGSSFATSPSRRCRSTCVCCTRSPGRPWRWTSIPGWFTGFLLRVTDRPSVLVPWQSLKLQFGADFSATPRGLLDFKRQFVLRLNDALLFYPEADVTARDKGLLVAACRLRIRHTGGGRLSSL